jgi:hypothetical protein
MNLKEDPMSGSQPEGWALRHSLCQMFFEEKSRQEYEF